MTPHKFDTVMGKIFFTIVIVWSAWVVVAGLWKTYELIQ